MLAVLRFWLDRGVDGFRVDAIHHLIEAEHLQATIRRIRTGAKASRRRAGSRGSIRSTRRRRTTAIAEMRALADTYEDRVLIGEASLPIEQLMAYYGK